MNVAQHSDACPGRVLLTGAHGFTGQHLRRLLASAGCRVFSATLGAATHPDEVTLDITLPESCRHAVELVRPDYVVHLAAISFVQHQDALAFYRVNVLGTLNLLQALADAKILPRKVLVASSANVYGNADVPICSEMQLPQPVNHYAASKLAMEHMVSTWFDRLPIVLTRPFNYTGIGQAPQFLIPKMVSHFAERKQSIELGNLDVERDFSDVRMVVDIYKKLLESDCSSEIVNVCSGEAYSLRQILAMISDVAGYEIAVKVNPLFVRQNEVRRLTGSVAKLRTLTGAVSSYPMQETLRWMYDSAEMEFSKKQH